MNLRLFNPSDELKPFIKCYYLSECLYTNYVKDVFFADGCVEVVFHFGLDFYRGEEKESWAKVIGQITQPLTMAVTGKGKSFGIWFWPHTFSRFSSVPLNELNDKALPLDNIFTLSFMDSIKNCVLENDTENLIKQANVYLSGKLKSKINSCREKILEYAIRYILREKAASNLDRLASDCNTSSRNLQKMFKEGVGFSPKFFMRIVRFQSALQHLVKDETISLTDLAYRNGYYDQAHFIKEFRGFTGMSPSQFHLSKHPINQFFLNL